MAHTRTSGFHAFTGQPRTEIRLSDAEEFQALPRNKAHSLSQAVYGLDAVRLPPR
jgi:hypothetical protein